MSSECGRRIVEMVWEDLRPDAIVTDAAVRNAAIVAMATGCSTNAVIHLIAIARRAGLELDLDDLDALGRTTPVVANIRPSGKDYLMEDFYYAGGLRALMAGLGDRLDGTAMTVAGIGLGDAIAGAEVYNDDVIRPLSNPVYPEGALAVLRGNIAPDGCVIKPAAAAPHLLSHDGRAVVFDTYPEMKAAVEDEGSDITADDIMVFRGAGPEGGPGMPEWGMLPIPKTLVRQGVRDMLRISDARMSGTSYGACILHVAPEAHVGGPLALVRTGDRIRVDVPSRRIDLLVDDAELERRRAAWVRPKPYYGRGYGWMFARHIRQANEGCDFDFLETGFGAPAPEPDIF
jgi:dihydroxy-acid dehydratase